MGNTPTGTVSNVAVGSARLLIAPIGSPVPTLDGSVYPVVFDAAWKEVGYTEAGTAFAYNPTFKDIMVDEELATILKMLDGEKCNITANLAESTMENLNKAISASLLVTDDPDVKVVHFGSGDPVEVMVALEGLAGINNNKQRIIIGYRAISTANVQMAFKRAGMTVLPVDFSLMPDSTKDKGKRLGLCATFTPVAS
jgi:hypothetical protein